MSGRAQLPPHSSGRAEACRGNPLVSTQNYLQTPGICLTLGSSPLERVWRGHPIQTSVQMSWFPELWPGTLAQHFIRGWF